MDRFRNSHFLLLALLGPSVALVACHRESKPQERYYQLKGTVVSVDRGHKQIIVNHEAIPGFMAAMTMSYAVKDDAALNQLEAGDRISARVVVTSDDMWLDNIVIHKKGEPPQPKPSVEHPIPPTRRKAP
jgi:protein SCO1